MPWTLITIIFFITILAVIQYLQVQDKKRETLAQQLSTKARLAINQGAHSLTAGVFYAVASLSAKPTAEGRYELERGFGLLPAPPVIDVNNGQYIAAASKSGNLKVWALTEDINPTEDLVQEACARIPQSIKKNYVDIGLPADPCDSGNSNRQ